MRIYDFDEVDGELQLLPMAARRALDRAGRKLSLSAWQALPVELRRALTSAGSAVSVDVGHVLSVLRGVTPSPEAIEALQEAPNHEPPDDVRAAFGDQRPIPGATWSALSPLDRYALVKVALRKREPRLRHAYQEIIGQSAHSTHLEPGGGVRMVDVGQKQVTRRLAQAESFVTMNEAAFTRLLAGDAPKGDVLQTARLAGIMAAKRTPEWIPLCHSIKLTKIGIELTPETAQRAIRIVSRVEALDQTGVEMEALVAANCAALTVYDMLKAFDKGMQIGPTRLLTKTGGRGGDYQVAPKF